MIRRPSWVLCFLLVLILLPWCIDLRPNDIDLAKVLQRPSTAHFLGTDENGRDVLARLLAGAQVTLGIGVASATISMIVGSALGTLAGTFGRAVDDFIMRATDMALALPTLFVILLFSTLIRPGVLQVILLIGLTGWMPVARIVRGATREVVTRQYVLAASSIGARPWRITRYHVLPNLRPVILVTANLQLSRAILTEATISFLGVGIQPPDATWGSMLSSAQSYLLIAPWLAIVPGVALSIAMLLIANLSFAQETSPEAPSTRRRV